MSSRLERKGKALPRSSASCKKDRECALGVGSGGRGVLRS